MIAKALVRALLVVLLLNAVFLIIAIYSASIPSGRVASTVRHAFVTGALTEYDFLVGDRTRGLNQYDDCLIIQLIVNDAPLFDKALAPVLKAKRPWVMCPTLHDIVMNGNSEFQISFGYTRYWHGDVPIAQFLLSTFGLETARIVLKVLVYASFVVLGLSALRAPIEVRSFAWSIGMTTALFWAVPYFGQTFAHAPGDTFLMLGLAGFIFFSDRMRVWRSIFPYCAAYGAVVAYLDYFTGQVPTAAGLLFTAAYLSAVVRPDNEGHLADAWVTAGASVLAFTGGAALTVVLKQVLAVVFTDAPVLDSFLGQLKYYSSTSLSDGSWASGWGRLSGILALVRSGAGLTWGSVAGALGLGVAVAAAWCDATFLAWRRRRTGLRAISDLLAFASGASAVLFWTAVFSVHTVAHAFLLNRMLILPIALGFAAVMHQARCWDMVPIALTGKDVFGRLKPSRWKSIAPVREPPRRSGP